MNKIINLYQAFFSSHEKDRDEEAILKFIQEAIQSGNSAFHADVVKRYMENSQFVERKIIDHILNMEKIHLDVEYLSIYRKQMNATCSSYQDDKAIIVDELWSFTLLSFFLTVFSLAYDSGTENFSRCIKNCFVLLDLQGQKHRIGIHNLNDIEQMISLPPNIMHLAMDSFWTAWTFVIGHELYHLTTNSHAGSDVQEELDADSYGYKILIEMIEAQKKMNIPAEIKVFTKTIISPLLCYLNIIVF